MLAKEATFLFMLRAINLRPASHIGKEVLFIKDLYL